MKHLRLFEEYDSFYKENMYVIILTMDDYNDVVELATKLVNLFNSKNIEFRTFFAQKGDSRFSGNDIPDDDYIVFLFNRNIKDDGIEISSVNTSEDECPKLTEIELGDIPRNIEVARIPNNDIEFYITANKYNL